MLRTILVDDEEPALEWLKNLIGANGTISIVGSYTNPNEAIGSLRAGECDVVFLDIDMPGINGIEAAERILAIDPKIDIIFVTAYNHYATEAFELSAIDYVLKPVTVGRLNKAVARLMARRQSTAPVQFPTETNSGKAGIVCFGRFDLIDQRKEASLVKWRTLKERELMAYLVHNRNKWVPKEKILENLWPNADPEQATTYLHTCVYNIRKKWNDLGFRGVLEFKNNGYFLDVRGINCDVDEFGRLIAEKPHVTAENISEYERLTQLYKGDYMEEDGFLWSIVEQERLKEDYLGLLIVMAAYYLSEKECKSAISCLRRVLRKNPFHDIANEMMLKSYALMGDRLSMLRHYEHFTTMLKDELGLAPLDSTVKLFTKLCNGNADDLSTA